VPEKPGLIIFLGSGETSASGQKVFDWLLRRLPPRIRVAILETPAGFELNSAQVAGRIGDFLDHHLQNYQPQVTIVPARKRGTPFSPDEPGIAELVLGADVIFMGPGSPTYAVRQLKNSLAWHTTIGRHRLGAALVLASAATVAAGAYALPVYEIYKVGEELHWESGLDLLKPYGLSLVFVPHWNNSEGGPDLDTSRCYMGRARFDQLLDMLPPGITVIGIDEHTAVALDLDAEAGQVLGQGSVSLLCNGTERRLEQGMSFPLSQLGPVHKPEPQVGLPAQVWEQVKAAQVQPTVAFSPSSEVLLLVKEREAARARHDWPTADALRAQIASLGWRALDTRDGPQLEWIE
jgi:hypothetical protein